MTRDELKSEVKRLHDLGFMPHQIAKKLKMNESTVRKILKE